VAFAAAQTSDGGLQRRAWLGVALGPHDAGVLVTAIVDGSSAASAGLRAGDVIQAVDGGVVRDPPAVIAAVGRRVSGDTTRVEIFRGAEAHTREMVLRPFPRETLPATDFEYAAVTLEDGSRLRTIASVPTTAGRHAAVMLIQGGGCGSVDVPMAPDTGPAGLLRTIASHGYVTMRVEKSGVGDSRGPACEAIGYAQELEGYRLALAALMQHPRVDVERVVLLGISLGGVFAPLSAQEHGVSGIVVYGTLGSPPSPYPGRSERFFREFGTVDVRAAWAAVSARVLVLHGEFDETVALIDDTQIALWVNANRPGAATYSVLPGLDHCWTRHSSMEASRSRCGQGEAVPTLADAILDFLRGNRRARP
jgi:dienelactone hydrolase